MRRVTCFSHLAQSTGRRCHRGSYLDGKTSAAGFMGVEFLREHERSIVSAPFSSTHGCAFESPTKPVSPMKQVLQVAAAGFPPPDIGPASDSGLRTLAPTWPPAAKPHNPSNWCQRSPAAAPYL